MSSITPELARIWQRIQVCLLPGVEECLDDALTQRLKQLIAILEIVRIEEHVAAQTQAARGRPRQDRRPIARAFVAKAIYNLPATDLLIEMLHLQPNLRRLCGWECKRQIPSPATFSRAFAEFAGARLADRVHAALVEEHIGEQVVMHVSRVSHLEQVGRRRHPDQRPREGSAQTQGTAPAQEEARQAQKRRGA